MENKKLFGKYEILPNGKIRYEENGDVFDFTPSFFMEFQKSGKGTLQAYIYDNDLYQERKRKEERNRKDTGI